MWYVIALGAWLAVAAGALLVMALDDLAAKRAGREEEEGC
jgi:hypothetical protein